MTNEKRSKLISKIQKLQSLADSAGSDEEALAALGKIAELMDQYGLSMSEVTVAEETEDEGVSVMRVENKTTNSRWAIRIAGLVKLYTHCDYTYFNRRGSSRTINFYGDQNMVETAKWLFHYLESRMESGISAAYQKARNEGKRTSGFYTAYRRSFVRGCHNKIKEIRTAEMEQAVSTALIPLNEKIQRVLEKKGVKKVYLSDNSGYNADASEAGYQHGYNTSFSRELESA